MPTHDPNVPHRDVGVLWHITQEIRRLEPLHDAVVNGGDEFGYRLVDLEMGDGRVFRGVLVIHDHVLVPDTEEWQFDGMGVVAVRPTAGPERPPLAIASAETLLRHGCYSHADVLRMTLFLESDDEHEEQDESGKALDGWAPDLDPCYRVGRAVLTPNGWNIAYQPRPGAEMAHVVLAHPRTVMLWDDILSGRVRVEGDATLRHLLLTLRALDETSLVYVQGFLRLWPGIQLRSALEAAVVVPARVEPDPDLEELEVGWRGGTTSDEGGGPDELYLSPDASMKGPAVGDAEASGGRWSLWGARWATALDLPIRANETLVVPPVHDEIMAWLAQGRGMLPRQPMPERDRYQVPLTWADALGAILGELGGFDPDRERERDADEE